MYIIGLLLYIQLTSLHAIVLQHVSSDNLVVVKAWNLLPFKEKIVHLNTSVGENIPIIPLHLPNIYGYDPCIEGEHQPLVMEGFVRDWYRNASALIFETSINETLTTWVASMAYDQLTDTCEGKTPLHLWYAPYIALHAQRLGASALLTHGSPIDPQIERHLAPPGTDIASRTVHGVEITIPGLIHNNHEVASSSAMMSTQIVNVDSIQWTLKVNKENSSLSGKAAAPFTSAFNEYDSMFTTSSNYRNITAFVALCAVVLVVFTAGSVYQIVHHFIAEEVMAVDGSSASGAKKRKKACMSLTMRLMILIPEILGAVALFLISVDPFGNFLIFDYFSARVLVNLRGTMVATTDVTMAIYCYDVYTAFKASKKMNPFTPFLLRYWFAVPVILFLDFTLVISDYRLSLMALNLEVSQGAVPSYLIPAVSMLLIYAVTTWYLLHLNKKVKNEVETLSPELKKFPEVEAMIDRTNKLRAYMRLAAIGRVLNIVALVMAASGIMFTSPLMYSMTALLLLIPSAACSMIQILITVEITPNAFRRSRGQKSSRMAQTVPRHMGINVVAPEDTKEEG